MIDFYNGQITDLLPGNLTDDPAVKAFSLALREGTRLLQQYTQVCYIYCSIDTAPDEVLDLMAAELRTQYYSGSLDIETKRSLIRNTLIWYMTAGTPAAVEELVAAVFGEGEVAEWFEYGGDPYCFKIKTNATLTEDMDAFFSSMIRRVKNTRSHLEAIEVHRTVNQPYFAGCCAYPHYKPAAIIDGYSEDREVSQPLYAGAVSQQAYKPAAIIGGYSEAGEVGATVYAGVGEAQQVHQAAILEGLNYTGDKVSTEGAYAGTAAAGTARPAAIIDGGTVSGEVQMQLGAATAAAGQTKPAAIMDGGSTEGEDVSEAITAGAVLYSRYTKNTITEGGN